MNRRLWGAGGLLLVIGIGVSARQILWIVYRAQVQDSTSAATLGQAESTFFFWFSGLALFATIGLVAACLLLLPETFTLPDFSIAFVPIAAAATAAVHFVAPHNPAWIASAILAAAAVWLAGAIAGKAYGERAQSATLVLLGVAPFFLLTASVDVWKVACAVGVLGVVYGTLDERWYIACGVGNAVAIVAHPLQALALLAPWWIALLVRDRTPRKVVVWLAPTLGALAYLFVTGKSGGNAESHTITLGILYDFVSLFRLNAWLLGWPLSLLLVCCAPITRTTKLIAASIATFLVAAAIWLPAGIPTTGPADYFEAGCLLVILAAAALARFPPRVATAIGIAIVLVNLAFFLPLQLHSLHEMAR